jgi:hypothetical protein
MASGALTRICSKIVTRNVALSKSLSFASINHTFGHQLILQQPRAGYRAAVLHEIGKPLIIEDVKPQSKLKKGEVLFLVSHLFFQWNDTIYF